MSGFVRITLTLVFENDWCVKELLTPTFPKVGLSISFIDLFFHGKSSGNISMFVKPSRVTISPLACKTRNNKKQQRKR